MHQDSGKSFLIRDLLGDLINGRHNNNNNNGGWWFSYFIFAFIVYEVHKELAMEFLAMGFRAMDAIQLPCIVRSVPPNCHELLEKHQSAQDGKLRVKLMVKMVAIYIPSIEFPTKSLPNWPSAAARWLHDTERVRIRMEEIHKLLRPDWVLRFDPIHRAASPVDLASADWLWLPSPVYSKGVSKSVKLYLINIQTH